MKTEGVNERIASLINAVTFNFSTLATRAYGYATEELLKEASLWCLTIVAVGLFPVLFLNRQLRETSARNYKQI